MNQGRADWRERGVAIVEAALTLLLFFTVLLAIMEMGRLMNVQQVLTNAAREGARLSVAPLSRTSTLASAGEIQTKVDAFLSSANISGATTTVEQGVVINGTQFTRVTLSMSYQPITPLFGSMTLRGEALMRNETSP